MATYSSILAWRIPWTEEPDGLNPQGHKELDRPEAIYRQFVIANLPRSKRLLIPWLVSPSTVILGPKKMKSVTAFTISPSICQEERRLDAMILVYLIVSFNQIFTLLFHPHQQALYLYTYSACKGLPWWLRR